MLDASSDGALLSKSYEEGYKLIVSIIANTYQWLVTIATIIVVPKKPIGVYEVTQAITLAAQVAKIHQMMKIMMTSYNTPAIDPIKVVTNVNVVACVYNKGAYLFK